MRGCPKTFCRRLPRDPHGAGTRHLVYTPKGSFGGVLRELLEMGLSIDGLT